MANRTSPLKIRPAIFLITPGILTEENFKASSHALIDRLSIAASSGVDVIQIREKKLSASKLSLLVREVMCETRDSQCLISVNERFDVAIAVGAHGVHLTSSSIPAEVVRMRAPKDFIIGKSIHSLSEIASSKPFVDYFFFSPIFDTPSKIGLIDSQGVGGLELAVQASAPVPLIALGGINIGNVGEVSGTGAAGIAGISLFETDQIAETVDKVRREFR